MWIRVKTAPINRTDVFGWKFSGLVAIQFVHTVREKIFTIIFYHFHTFNFETSQQHYKAQYSKYNKSKIPKVTITMVIKTEEDHEIEGKKRKSKRGKDDNDDPVIQTKIDQEEGDDADAGADGDDDNNEGDDEEKQTKRKRKRRRKNKGDGSAKNSNDNDGGLGQEEKLNSLDHTVYVEGIPFDCTEDEVKGFFLENGCEDVLQLRLQR